jgi:hypothetical protein
MNDKPTSISAEILDRQDVAVILATEHSTYVMYGTARSTADGVVIEMDSGGTLPIPEDVMPRFQKVTDDDRADPDFAHIVEDAAFLVSMSVGNVSDADAAALGMTATGVRLPTPEADS